MILTVKDFTRLGIRLSTNRFLYFFFSYDEKIRFWTDEAGGKVLLTKDELEEMHREVKNYHVVAAAVNNR
jgi:hypothetical protein